MLSRARRAELIRNPVVRSSLWSFGGFGVGQVLRLVSNLIMTRLLVPEAFGLMALVMIFMVGLELFTDLGIGASVIQNKRGDQAVFIETAWTIKVIRSVLIAICVWLLADPFAWFYDEPQLRQILPVMALTTIFTGLSSVAPTVANRKLWVGRVTIMTIVCQVVSLFAMILWAWHWPSVWALVFGIVVNTMVRAVLSHLIFPQWRTRFRWDPDVVREIVHFGKWMFLTSALTFAAGQIDRLTLAKLMPFELVGIYSIGFMWAALPWQLVQSWSGRVLFPFASETIRDPEGDRRRLIAYRRRVIWVAAVGLGIFGGLATPIFHLLYTPAYWPAADFFSLILIGTFIRILDELYRPFNLALGQPKYTSVAAGSALFVFAASVYPLYSLYAAHGIALAFSLSQFGTFLASAVGVRRGNLSDLRMDAMALCTTFAIWGGLYAAVRALGW